MSGHFMLLLLFLLQIFSPKTFDYKELSKEILLNNQIGRHYDSNNKIINLLENNKFNNKQLAQIHLLRGITYRSLNDYPTSLKYLLKAEDYILTFDQKDSLKISIMSELAHTYFDMKNYEESGKIMDVIESFNYQNIEPIDKAYIIMQKGYIHFLKNDFNSADKLYEESLRIISKVAPCHKPVILVKCMQLYGAQKKFNKVEKIYRRTFAIADSCNILKYKIYSLEEVTRIYNANNINAFKYNRALDSLKSINEDKKQVARLHLRNEDQIQAAYDKQQKYTWLIAILCAVVIITSIMFYFRVKKKHKIIKRKLVKSTNENISIKEKKYNEILGLENFTDRQNEIIKLIIEGLGNKEIAERLFLSEATVKYHIKNIYEKLEIKSRKDLLGKLYNK